jgi:hypothetical protein
VIFLISEVWSEAHILLIELHKSILKIHSLYLGASSWEYTVPNWLTVQILTAPDLAKWWHFAGQFGSFKSGILNVRANLKKCQNPEIWHFFWMCNIPLLVLRTISQEFAT